LQLRVESLRESACLSIFLGVSQALYPQHKLIFAAELCFRGLIERRSLDPRLLLYLVKGIQTTPTIESPFQDWLGASQWQAIVELSSFEMGDGEDAEGNPVQDRPFSGLPTDIHGSSRRFRDWYDLERPEEAPLPGEWRKIPEVNKLLVIQALRPDRLVHAISTFVRNEIGSKFLVARRIRLSKVYEDSSPQVPILFLLSPGVDPVKDVEALGEIHEIHYENRKLALVCLGQGQEAVAETTLNDMRVKGGWVFIQNLHLLKDWTMGFLQDRVEELSDAHESFRLFLSMEPSLAPITILKTSIKLTNEAPDGLQANILKALQPFQEEFFEMSTSPAELKAVVFGACVLHAVVIQRKKFGAIGKELLIRIPL
jgi:dynein heavy chain